MFPSSSCAPIIFEAPLELDPSSITLSPSMFSLSKKDQIEIIVRHKLYKEASVGNTLLTNWEKIA